MKLMNKVIVKQKKIVDSLKICMIYYKNVEAMNDFWKHVFCVA
jgi:hypothetical protein